MTKSSDHGEQIKKKESVYIQTYLSGVEDFMTSVGGDLLGEGRTRLLNEEKHDLG